MISELVYKFIQKISFIKKFKIYDFGKEIIFSFLVKMISKFFKDEINEKLIVMGGQKGGGFFGNTKYIFKFLEKKSDYILIWITKFDKILNKLNKKGYNVLPQFSLRTIKTLRKAKYIFLTHGYYDVLPIDFSPKTKIILTWHGVPIKKLHRADTLIFSKWADIFRLNLKYHQYVDYLLTPSRGLKEKKILASTFNYPIERILELGYPKNDILINKKDDKHFIKKLKNKYKIPDEINKIILYAPTWRRNIQSGFPFSQKTLFELNTLLNDLNSLMLLKIHILQDFVNLSDYKNIRIIEKTGDIQELALISDCLVTDYSSICFDYLLTMKPIIFFPYDFKRYKEEWGFYYEYGDVTPGPIVYYGKDLLNLLKDIDKIDKEYHKERKKMRDRFLKYHDGKSTERLLDFLNIKYVK
jgi:CDP-glycerol glycerophosphotransferase